MGWSTHATRAPTEGRRYLWLLSEPHSLTLMQIVQNTYSPSIQGAETTMAVGKSTKMLSTWTTGQDAPYCITSSALASSRFLQACELILCDCHDWGRSNQRKQNSQSIKVGCWVQCCHMRRTWFQDYPGLPSELLTLLGYCWLEMKEVLDLSGKLAEEYQVPGLTLAELGGHPKGSGDILAGLESTGMVVAVIFSTTINITEAPHRTHQARRLHPICGKSKSISQHHGSFTSYELINPQGWYTPLKGHQ